MTSFDAYVTRNLHVDMEVPWNNAGVRPPVIRSLQSNTISFPNTLLPPGECTPLFAQRLCDMMPSDGSSVNECKSVRLSCMGAISMHLVGSSILPVAIRVSEYEVQIAHCEATPAIRAPTHNAHLAEGRDGGGGEKRGEEEREGAGPV